MNLVQVIIMGIVQGLSEFLPISSSGHLVFSSSLYKHFSHAVQSANTVNQEVFLDIMLHLGTLIAVLIFFRKDIAEIVRAFCNGVKNKQYDNQNFRLGVYIILGTVFTLIVAYPLSTLAARLVFLPHIVAILLIFTGGLLLFGEWWNKIHTDKKRIDMKSSAIIGIAQGLASLPGFSRSGFTIAAALLLGHNREEAARFSFLLSIPIILGASMIYPLVTIDYSEVITYNWFVIIIGTIISGIVGYFCIKYFLKFVSKFSLSIFGYYCILAGIFFILFFI